MLHLTNRYLYTPVVASRPSATQESRIWLKCPLTTLDSTGPKDKTGLLSTTHREYEQGYIVFYQNDNYKEIWRRTVDEVGE